MENSLYEMEHAGTFSDDSTAWRLRVLSTFTMQGVTIKEGTVSQARFDGNCEIVNSWVFGHGEIRSAQIQGSIIGLERQPDMPMNHFIENCIINSCVVKAERMVARRVDMNDVHSKTIKFFGAVGNENFLILRDVKYPVSVRQYNTTYAEYREFLKEVDRG